MAATIDVVSWYTAPLVAIAKFANQIRRCILHKIIQKTSKKVASRSSCRHFWVIHGKHFDIIACRWVGGQRKNQHRPNGFQRVPKVKSQK